MRPQTRDELRTLNPSNVVRRRRGLRAYTLHGHNLTGLLQLRWPTGTRLIDRNPPLLAGLLLEQDWAGRLVGSLKKWDGAGEPTGAGLALNRGGMIGDSKLLQK